ncbi:hypothetical protein PHMEG_00012235 [Phytophthora megakarya]|uniref:SCAN domain-containing protein n=1 Tax=Phytophthora megakarya TaxID=4795 RepID=A0A225WBU8_9STRA|nr:hypothetical protein PHMEG_00012235 [Phytophthora megakarya]
MRAAIPAKERPCGGCCDPVGNIHSCSVCDVDMHPFCGAPVGKEGFGQPILYPGCQGLLGFIDQEDYDRGSETTGDTSDDEYPPSPKTVASHPPPPSPSEELLSDTGTAPLMDSPDGDTSPDDAVQPKCDGSSGEDSSSGNTSEANSTDTPSSRPPKTTAKSPPEVKSFTETKRDKEIRRTLLRAHTKKDRAKIRAAKKRAARKPSSHERRGSTAHGDPYYINHYLMTIKYEEGTDLMGFFLTFERALTAAAEATGIVMTDELKSLYLYHAMSSTWKPDMAIRKGSKKFIPYTDLKANIERKVLDDYVKRK